MLWTMVALALAGQTGADTLEQEWRSLRLLRADPTRYRVVDQPFTVTDGPLKLTVHSGLLVPIFSGHTPNDRDAMGKIRLEGWAEDGVPISQLDRGNVDFVGFVWVAGDGQAEVSWNERADAQSFANHMVRNLKNDRADYEGVAHGEPWTTEVHEGFVATVDPAIRQLFLGPKDLGGDPLEVVVYNDRPKGLDRARVLFDQRGRRLDRLGLDLGQLLAVDRVAKTRGLTERGAHGVVDLHVDQDLGWIHAARDDQRPVHWMTLIRDETGMSDPRRHTAIHAIDESPGGDLIGWRITGVPFPPVDPNDPLSPPAAPVRLDLREAFSIVSAADLGATLGIDVVSRLEVEAVGGRIDSFELNVPRHSKHGWKLVSATLPDGTSLLADTPLLDSDPLVAVGTPQDDDDVGTADGIASDTDAAGTDPIGRETRAKALPEDPYHERPETRVTLIPPAPLLPGDRLVVDVRWKDRWPLAAYTVLRASYSNGIEASQVVQLGSGSGRQSVTPRLMGAPEGNPAKFRVRVLTMHRKTTRSAASGALISDTSDDYWRTVESGELTRPGVFADVAVGPFHDFDRPGGSGSPTIRTRLFDNTAGRAMAPEVGRMIAFYQGYLPNYPWPEHEVFQSPGQVGSYVWVASHEMTALQKSHAIDVTQGARLARGMGDPSGRTTLAHEIAHQWWGHSVRPAHRDDFWFAETLAESMAQIYAAAQGGDYVHQMERKRETWEKFEDLHIPRASLTDAYSSPFQPQAVYEYGPVVFQEMLKLRMGHERYHAALDLLAREQKHTPTTTEQIERMLSIAADRDLSDFFDFWVHAGFIPEEVSVEWAHADGVFEATVRSDVPFGTFDVPVVVDGKEHWVEVVDGEGELRIERAMAPLYVRLDPDGAILAGKRTVR